MGDVTWDVPLVPCCLCYVA